MKEGFYRSEFIPPEERYLHYFKGKTLKEVIEYLEGEDENIEENSGHENWVKYQNREGQSIFDGFLDLLREKGVRVSGEFKNLMPLFQYPGKNFIRRQIVKRFPRSIVEFVLN